MADVELVIVHATELVSLAEFGPGPQRGPCSALETITDGAVAIAGGMITDVDTTEAVLARQPRHGATSVIDARGCAVVPGFIDAHAHMLYAGSRADEYAMRVAGLTYHEISARGGGIVRTVRETAAARDDTLLDLLVDRLGIALANGTTTAEIKTGYWLTPDGERHALDIIATAARRQPIDLVPTFLGAHAVPPELRDDPDRYVAVVTDEMLPKVAGAARFCDVVCDVGGFSPGQTRKILSAAAAHGLNIKLHADEFRDVGAAALAAELGAFSADHLCFVSRAGLGALAAASTVAVLLPATRHYLLAPRYADARALVEAGVPVALGTDHGPSSPTVSMPFVMALACSELRLTPAEALVAATWNAAHAVGAAATAGRLAPGYQADLLILAIPTHRDLPYFVDRPVVRTVVKAGTPLPGAARP